jgi:hypothetical protein
MAKKTKAKGKKRASQAATGTKVPMHVVVHFVRMLHDREHAAKFIAHAKRSKASIMVPPKGVDLINNYVKKHNLQTVRTARGVDACPSTNPWKCDDDT